MDLRKVWVFWDWCLGSSVPCGPLGKCTPFCKLWEFSCSTLLPHGNLAVIVLTLIQKFLAWQMPCRHVKTKLFTQQKVKLLFWQCSKLSFLKHIALHIKNLQWLKWMFACTSVWSFFFSLKSLMLNTERCGPYFFTKPSPPRWSELDVCSRLFPFFHFSHFLLLSGIA